MKLHNKTRCPDLILTPLLVAAGRKVGANTGKVLVRVSQGRVGGGVSGMAERCDLYRIGKRWIRTDGGTFSIVLPWYENAGNADPDQKSAGSVDIWAKCRAALAPFKGSEHMNLLLWLLLWHAPVALHPPQALRGPYCDDCRAPIVRVQRREPREEKR